MKRRSLKAGFYKAVGDYFVNNLINKPIKERVKVIQNLPRELVRDVAAHNRSFVILGAYTNVIHSGRQPKKSLSADYQALRRNR